MGNTKGAMTALEEWLRLVNTLNEEVALLWKLLKMCEKDASEWKVAAHTVGERLIATELRLEQCETELKKQAQAHLHYIAACDQTEEELKGRLEQCEAALREAKQLIGNAKLNACFCEKDSQCDWCRIDEAARAALEGK